MLTMIIEFKSRSFAPPPRPKKRLVDILSYPHQSGGNLDVVGFVVGLLTVIMLRYLLSFVNTYFLFQSADVRKKYIAHREEIHF